MKTRSGRVAASRSIVDTLKVDSTRGPMFQHTRCTRSALVVCAVIALAAAPNAGAQAVAVDSLVAHALSVSPSVHATAARLDAARHRGRASGVWVDPMLMAGIQNLPLGRERAVTAGGMSTSGSGPDPMTMRMIGVSQTIPYPGKLSLQRAVAQREIDASAAAVDLSRRQIVRDVKAAYYEIVSIDHALVIIEQSQSVLATIIRITEGRYGVGQSGQQDVLKARVEATRLAESTSSLLERRRSVVATLNALMDQPSETPVARAAFPPNVVRAAIGDSTRDIRFASATLGARITDSPLPPVAELQEQAIRESPELREHQAMIAAQEARLELAHREYLPDVSVSLQYGQRGGGLPDMITASVSLPLPVHKRRKQDAFTAEASSALAALRAEHAARVNELRADVARLVADLERQRTQLALYRKAILPQGTAARTAALTSYQVGKTELLPVLDSQTSLFTYETDYYRALSEFATSLAELERVVGRELLP